MSGEYTCIANNSIPKTSPKAVKKGTFVRVKHKPILDMKVTITKKACDKEKVVVPNCVLTCQASGTPDVTFTWLRRGNNIQEGDKYGLVSSTVEVMSVKSELEIKTVKSDDYDNYTCIASNGLGDVRHHVALSVTGKPDPPVHFSAVDATDSTVTLRWSLDFTGGYKLADIGYKLRQKKAGSESYVYRDIPKVIFMILISTYLSTWMYREVLTSLWRIFRVQQRIVSTSWHLMRRERVTTPLMLCKKSQKLQLWKKRLQVMAERLLLQMLRLRPRLARCS